jgi:hypothetical protein
MIRDGRPEGCCAHHDGNPRHLPVGPDGRPLAAPVLAGMLHATIPPGRPADWQAPHERVAEDRDARNEQRPIEDVAPAAAYADALGIPLDVEPEPYRRRWPAAEITCTCPTPWDHLVTKDGKPAEKGIGYHAVCCHTNWRNASIAAMHKRSILDPCRPPQSIVDIETGVRVLRARDEGGYLVWG